MSAEPPMTDEEARAEIQRLRAALANAQRSEKRYRNLAEAIPDMLLRADAHGNVDFYSQRVLEYLGCSLPELLARGWGDYLHPDERARFIEDWHVSVASGEPFEACVRILRHDGGYRWHLVRSRPIKEAGRVLRWYSACTDIDDQRRLQEELALWYEFFMQSSLGFAITDTETCTFRLVNDAFAAMHGTSRAALIGRPFGSVFSSEFQPTLPERLERLVARGNMRHETEHIRENGQTFPVFAEVFTLYERPGIPRWRAALIQDISERKAGERALQELNEELVVTNEELISANEELIAANEALALQRAELSQAYEQLQAALEEARRLGTAKDEFLGVVSHELRTPLTAIRNAAAILSKGRAGALNEDQQRFTAMIADHAVRLNALVNDLLDLQASEVGSLRFELAPGDLAQLAAEVLASFAPVLLARGLRARLDVPDAPVVLTFDAKRLGQVLLNLLSNAAKFTPEGGEVVVSVAVESQEVRLLVCDSGQGIASADAERIFEKFVQLESGTTRSVGGSGLGLAITKRFVETGHGGRIWVEPNVGGGSRFVVALPRG